MNIATDNAGRSGRAFPQQALEGSRVVAGWRAVAMLIATVARRLVRESSILAPDFGSFRTQESTFAGLNLFLLAALLVTHLSFSSYFGNPPIVLFVVLAAGLLVN